MILTRDKQQDALEVERERKQKTSFLIQTFIFPCSIFLSVYDIYIKYSTTYACTSDRDCKNAQFGI